MEKIATRTGELLEIALLDGKGNEKTLTKSEFDALTSFSSSVLKLIFVPNPFPSIKLLLLMVKKKLGIGYQDEKDYLLRKIAGFDANAVRVRFKGKEVRINRLHLIGIVKDVIVNNQYCVNEENIGGKIVADCGANIGIFSLLVSLYRPKKIYAFEPVRGTFELLKANIEANGLQEIIIPINKAVGAENTKAHISFSGGGDPGASIELHTGRGKEEEVEVVRMDDFFKSIPVNFIKMDIEGYESKAIKGAENIIRTHKPLLSFSAYHREGDVKNLSNLVLQIREDYKIESVNFCEEVLFCH